MNIHSLLGRLALGTKIAIAPAVTLLCLCAVAVVVHLSLARTESAMTQVEQVRLPAYETARQIKAGVEGLNTMVLRSIAWEGASFKADVVAAVDAAAARHAKAVRESIAAQAANPALDDEGRRAFAALLPIYDKFARSALESIDMKSAGLASAAFVMTTMEDDFKGLSERLDTIVSSTRRASSEDFGSALAHATLARRTLWIALTCALALGIAATWLAVRSIARPISRAEAVARAVADGDLSVSVEVEGSDATARMLTALGSVTTSLSAIVGDIRGAAEHIAGASNEIASGNQDLSARTEAQAANLQQTVASVDLLSATCRQSADNANEARTLATDASAVAGEGQQAMQRVATAMDSIQAHARRISEIVGVIDAIAFQTNILALNASVEAARAGELGRGFAVVAAEVRTLADRSSVAAREIRGLIAASAAQVEDGSQHVADAGRTMGRVVEAITSVEQRVARIHAATAEQAQGISQVHETIGGIDQATQHNAALVEQAAAAAETLRSQAAGLVTSVARFQLRSASHEGASAASAA